MERTIASTERGYEVGRTPPINNQEFCVAGGQ